MSDPKVVENLIIGTGFAGLATAMALRRRHAPFEVIDVGNDLDVETQQTVTQLAETTPDKWESNARKRLFPPAVASTHGVERRLQFGSDFPYRVPDALSVDKETCATELSHGLGGFGNVWGAAMLPYSDHSLGKWPIPRDQLAESYRNVLTYVPLSAERDTLQKTFPLYTDDYTTLERSRQTDALLKTLSRREEALGKKGVTFGRARVAVDSSGDTTTCRYCGLCLDGCVYGSIFNPRLLWNQLEADRVRIHRPLYALEFQERDEEVLVSALNTNNGSTTQWRTKRLFLAAGHFATARMIARSLGRLNESIRVRDSQYFFFPMVSYRAFREEIRFTLADIFLEILNRQLSENYLHFQIYGMNPIFLQTLRDLIPRPLPLTLISSRFYLLQGFLHSDDSGHLELSVTSSDSMGDDVLIRGVENPQALRIAKRSQSFLRKRLLTFGFIPPLTPRLMPPGRSFHTGGSFPIGGSDPFYSSDALGRPAGLKRVHIADSANFPDLGGCTIALTIMANADRIATTCATLA